MSAHKIDLTGQIFSRLVVIKREGRDKHYNAKWLCKCECGNETIVSTPSLRSGNTKSCGCFSIEQHKMNARENNPCFKGIGEMGENILGSIKRNAKARNIEHDITKEYLWDLYLKQNKKCAVTGLQLKFPSRSKSHNGTASLDRINNLLGYVEGNVQWVHKEINLMKRIFTSEEFIKWCKLVVEYNIETKFDNS